MTALAVAVVVDLHLCGVLAEDFDVNLVPWILLTVDDIGRTGVGEERGNNAVVLDCLHGALIVAVVIEFIGTVFAAGVVSLVSVISVTVPVLINGQVHVAVLDAGILLIPPVVKDRTVRPAVGSEKVACIAAAEVGVHGCRQLRLRALVLDLAGLLRGRRQNRALETGKVTCINSSVTVLVHVFCHARGFAQQRIDQHCGVTAVCGAVAVQVCVHACKCSTRKDACCHQQRTRCSHDTKSFFHPESSLFYRISLIAAVCLTAFFQYSILVCNAIS